MTEGELSHRCACFHMDETGPEREALMEVNRRSLSVSEEEMA